MFLNLGNNSYRMQEARVTILRNIFGEKGTNMLILQQTWVSMQLIKVFSKGNYPS